MEEKIIEKTEEKIKEILDDDITPSNLDSLYKLSKIKHMAKEDKEMNYGNYDNYGNYGNYGRRAGYDSYGRGNYGEYGNYGEGSYGRRGYDSKYRGHEQIDRIGENYGRYMEGRERYGANSEDAKRSLKYMLESMEDFAKMLREDAQSQEEVQMIRETAQRIAQM